MAGNSKKVQKRSKSSVRKSAQKKSKASDAKAKANEAKLIQEYNDAVRKVAKAQILLGSLAVAGAGIHKALQTQKGQDIIKAIKTKFNK